MQTLNTGRGQAPALRRVAPELAAASAPNSLGSAGLKPASQTRHSRARGNPSSPFNADPHSGGGQAPALRRAAPELAGASTPNFLGSAGLKPASQTRHSRARGNPSSLFLLPFNRFAKSPRLFPASALSALPMKALQNELSIRYGALCIAFQESLPIVGRRAPLDLDAVLAER